MVDRRTMGIVAMGIESFADAVEHHIYVDKAMVIADLTDRGGVTLFCQPRRFGPLQALRPPRRRRRLSRHARASRL